MRKTLITVYQLPSFSVGIYVAGHGAEGGWWLLHHSMYYSKTWLPASERLPPVLRLPASLIDYIALYKLSMVHKLCSSECYTPQRQPAATRTLRAPPPSLPLCPDRDLLSQLCDQIPGLRENTREIGVKEKFKTRCVFCACYSSLQR